MDRPPGSPAAALAPLYGREHDLGQLLALLRGGVRLLTLRGPGGIGKTALALHLIHALRGGAEEALFDHIQFIDLSAVREPEQVLGLIATSLPGDNFKGEPERRIQDFAAGRRTLLLLDNFEQILPAASALGELLAASDTLRLVVTSRAALRLHDEVEYPIEPLALAHGARGAASSAAVQLFVARAQAVTPSFALDAGNTVQVTRLCEVLEGVPLALELAAARTRSLALGDLLARLERPLDVLRADFRDRPERLRSLRAAVQWSSDLLDDLDRAVFECCAVFEGPFSPQALAAVWGSPEVLDRAESLLSQSFLQRLDTPETLWKMLQPLRELALEHLASHPQEAVWRERHALYFLNMMDEVHLVREGYGIDEHAEYLPHYPNIRAGMVWAVEQRHSDLAYRYLGAVGGLWDTSGLMAQEAPLAGRVLALPPPEDRAALVRALEISAEGLYFTGQFQAVEAQFREVVSLFRELGDVEGEAWASLRLVGVLCDTGRREQAREIRERIIRELQERVGDTAPTRKQRMLQSVAHLSEANDLLELGRYAEALESAQLACQSSRDMGQGGAVYPQVIVGYVLFSVHRFQEARTLLLSCLHDVVNLGSRAVVDHALRWGLIFVAAELRDWTTLIQFTAFVNDPVWADAPSVVDRRQRDDLARARKELGEAASQQAWTTGRQLQLADVLELAERLAQVPISPPIHPDLTPRELEVLALVSQGHPDRRVARLLGISPGTASKHVGNLLGKLGLHNRVELTRWAIEHAPPDGSESASPSEPITGLLPQVRANR